MFSSSPIPEKKSAFFSFLREAEKADEAAETPAEQAQTDEIEIEFETSQEGIKSDVQEVVEEIS